MFKVGDLVVFIHDYDNGCGDDDCLYLFMAKGERALVEDVYERYESLKLEGHWYDFVFDSVQIVED